MLVHDTGNLILSNLLSNRVCVQTRLKKKNIILKVVLSILVQIYFWKSKFIIVRKDNKRCEWIKSLDSATSH